ERVAPRFELLDVGLGLLVRRDRLADLLLIGRGGALEVAEVELGAEQPGEPFAESERRPWAGGERGVVGHRGPEARRSQVGAPAGVVEDADDSGGPFVA